MFVKTQLWAYILYMIMNSYFICIYGVAILHKYSKEKEVLPKVYFNSSFWGKLFKIIYSIHIFDLAKRRNERAEMLIIIPLFPALSMVLRIFNMQEILNDPQRILDTCFHLLLTLFLIRTLWMNRELKILANKLNQEQQP